jgi:hypothetical protein
MSRFKNINHLTPSSLKKTKKIHVLTIVTLCATFYSLFSNAPNISSSLFKKEIQFALETSKVFMG